MSQHANEKKNGTLCLGVINEKAETIDEVCAVERVAADSNDCGLAKSCLCCLVHSLVSEGAGSRHDADLPLLVDVARHDSDLTFLWLDDSRAVGSDQSSLVLRH